MIVMDLPPPRPVQKKTAPWGRFLPCKTCSADIGEPCKDFRGRSRKDGSPPDKTRIMNYPHPGRLRWKTK